jgi:hypothetical protein
LIRLRLCRKAHVGSWCVDGVNQVTDVITFGDGTPGDD